MTDEQTLNQYSLTRDPFEPEPPCTDATALCKTHSTINEIDYRGRVRDGAVVSWLGSEPNDLFLPQQPSSPMENPR